MAIDETRLRLLDAAGHEFASKGFEGATVRAICERAGVNLAAVNYHFGDKERLYEAVVLHAHRSEPKIDPAILQGVEPREALGRFIAEFVRRVFATPQHSWQQAVMFREFAEPTAASDALVREAIRPQFEILLSILGQLAPALDTRQVAATAISVVSQCLHYRICGAMTERIVGRPVFAQFDPAFLADHITRFSLAALGYGSMSASDSTTPAEIPPALLDAERGER